MGGSSCVFRSATSACSERSAASSMMTTRQFPSSGRSARSCCISRICSMAMNFLSESLSRSISLVTRRTSGCVKWSTLRQARHVPQPPAMRGSVVQRSVCASRIATVRLPIDRGPLSSYAWATSPSRPFSPRRTRRRRCAITSRTRVRRILGRRDTHPQESAILSQLPPRTGAALALEFEKPFEPLPELRAGAVGSLDDAVTLRALDKRRLDRAPLLAPVSQLGPAQAAGEVEGAGQAGFPRSDIRARDYAIDSVEANLARDLDVDILETRVP